MNRIFALFLLVAAAVRADEARLSISAENFQAAEKTISPELVGFNLLYWIDDQAAFESGQLARQINGINPGLLRYPAGTASQNYDWRSNQVINTNLFPYSPQNELLSTDAYIRLVKQTGAGGIVVVDIASAHLKDRKKGTAHAVAHPVSEAEEQAMVDKAMAWARHFKAKGFSPAFYELGNEHYLAFLDYMVFTPEMYAAKCKRFMAAIRAVDPDAKFAICGPSPFGRGHFHYKDTPWWPVVLKELAPDVDRLVLHKYWKPKQINKDVTAECGRFKKAVAEWGAQEGIAVDHLKIGFTEWGGRGHMDAETFGLFCFRVLSGLANEGIDFAVEWPFRWTEKGEFGSTQLIVRKSGKRRFAYHVLAVWSQFFSGKKIVPIASKLPRGIHAFAAIGENGDPALALSNEGKTAQSIQLVVAWPENIQTLELLELSASKVRKLGEKEAGKPKSVSVEPKTILILRVGKGKSAP